MLRLFGHFALEVREEESHPFEVIGNGHGSLVISKDAPRSSTLIFSGDAWVLEYFHEWASTDFTVRHIRIVHRESARAWTGTFLVSAFEKTIQLQSTGDLEEESRQLRHEIEQEVISSDVGFDAPVRMNNPLRSRS